MLKFLGFLCVYCSFVVGSTKNMDDIKKDYGDIVKGCMEEYPPTSEDMQAMANKKRTNNLNCIFACALKKSGMMDDDGNLSVEGVKKSAEKYFSDDPDLLKKSEMFTDACKSVNDIPVSDGIKGCERASLIFQCSVEKAPTFDLF